MSMEEKMQLFAPGVCDGQERFFRVSPSGEVTRHTLVPHCPWLPRAWGPEPWPAGRPLPPPGWYTSDWTPCGTDPSEPLP